MTFTIKKVDQKKSASPKFKESSEYPKEMAPTAKTIKALKFAFETRASLTKAPRPSHRPKFNRKGRFRNIRTVDSESKNISSSILP